LDRQVARAAQPRRPDPEGDRRDRSAENGLPADNGLPAQNGRGVDPRQVPSQQPPGVAPARPRRPSPGRDPRGQLADNGRGMDPRQVPPQQPHGVPPARPRRPGPGRPSPGRDLRGYPDQPRRPDPDDERPSITAIVARNVETADLEAIRIPLPQRPPDTPVGVPSARGRHRQALGRFQTLARGGALNLFGVAVSGSMQLLLTVVVARGVGASGTGAFFEAVALFTILSNIGELGADTGLVKILPQYRALNRNQDLRRVVQVALWPVVIFGIGLGAAAWLLAPELTSVLSHSQHGAEVESYLRTFAAFIPLGAITTVVLAGTRGMGTMAPFVAVQNIFLPAIRPILIGAALYLGLGSVAVALGWAAPVGAAFLLGILFLLRLVSRARSAGPAASPANRREISSEFWSFARPRALAAVFGITITWLDVLLVGAFLHSTRQAGIYAAASRLSVLGVTILSAVGMAIAPQISELATLGKMREAQSLFQVGTWWLIAITWPAYISLAIFAPFLLQVYGHRFAAGSVTLVILCLAQLFNLGTGNVTVVLLMVGKSSWNMINAGASLAINIGLNVFLIPRIGIAGAAIAWAAAIVCNNLAAVLEVNYLLKIRPFGRGYWVVVTASVVFFGMAGVIVRQILGPTLSGFALFALVSVPAYAAVLWRLRGMLGVSAFRQSTIDRRRIRQ
jgi:O-antigen/teichoic acid export membrane protein